MTLRSIPASAPAARTARACRSASASPVCAWTASPWAEPAETYANLEARKNVIHGTTPGPQEQPAAIDRRTGRHRAGRVRGESRDCRAVLCAVRLDGADAADWRRIAGDEIPLRLWHGVVAGVPRAAGYRARVFGATQARRRGRVPLAWRSFASLGQARHRPARRPDRVAQWSGVDQRPSRRAAT